MDTIHLGGLPPSETAALVAAHLGRESADRATRHGGCSTRPPATRSSSRSCCTAPAPPSLAGLPEGVKDVIGRRLDRLPPATLETLTLAAVLGSDFRLATLRGGVARPRAGRADRVARGRRGGAADRRGPERGRPLLVHARARARDALRAPDREPPGAPAPARGGGARGGAAAGAPGRAGASLLPGARGRRRGEGDRVQPQGGRGEPGDARVRGRGRALRARAQPPGAS